MNYPLPSSQHRDDIEPSSSAGLIESTYNSSTRPSKRMRQEIAPTMNPQADDPGSNPHASADDIAWEKPGRPSEDFEGMMSRKARVTSQSPIKRRSRGFRPTRTIGK